MKKNNNLWINLLPILLILSCASKEIKKELPEWVRNPTSKYHNALYMVGVGSGDSREEAKREAVASLSNIFSVDVSFDRRIIEAYSESRKGRDIDVDHSINLLTESALKSENRLINVREGDTYLDEKTGTFFVLVFINRTETEPLYLDEIKKNDEIVNEYYYLSKGTENKLEKFIYLKKAFQVASISEGLRQVHRLISTIDDTPAPPVTIQNLKMELNELSNKIIVDIKAKGDFNDELSGFIRELIQETGFTVGKQNPDLTLKANLNIKPIDLPREEIFVRWRLLIDVYNSLSGTTMETFSKEGREGHVSFEAARSRTLRTVRQILMDEFYIEFNSFLKRSLGE